MKLDGKSMDLEKINMEKLRSVLPECFSEQKLDIDKLEMSIKVQSKFTPNF